MKPQAFHIFILISIGFLALWLKLFHIQVMERTYYQNQGRRLEASSLPATRGKILTQDKVVLAEDRPSWDLMIVFRDWSFQTNLNLLKLYQAHSHPLTADTLETATKRAHQKLQKEEKLELKRSKRTSLTNYQKRLLENHPFLLLKKVPETIWQTVLSRPGDFPGLHPRMRPRRVYPQRTLAAHLIGSTSLFSAEDRKRKDQNNEPLYPFLLDLLKTRTWLDVATDPHLHGKIFFPYDVLGRTGLEKEYESSLKGRRGTRVISKEINESGQKIDQLVEERPAQPGRALTTTVDSRLQRICEETLALAGNPRGGGVVILDANTGAIQSMASWPTYRVGHITQKDQEDRVGRPLINKCLQEQIPAASTFKTVTAIATLEENIYSATTTIPCTRQGFQARGSPQQRCWIVNKYDTHLGHGPLPVDEALAHSCNIWFFNAGMRLKYTRLKKWAELFGFGKSTRVDLSYEASGQFPPRNAPEITNFAIGEGNFQATILQVAQMMASVATEGRSIRPHVGNVFGAISSEKLPVKKSTWKTIKKGLRKTVLEGTAWNQDLIDLNVSGKTGTAQLGGGRPAHLWFAGYCHMKETLIAFAICLFNADGGDIKAHDMIAQILKRWSETP